MQLANIVRERWKGVLFCLIVAIPATLLGKQIEVVGGPVFAILFGMVLALVFPKNRREQLAVGVSYTSKKVLQYAVILLGFGMNLSQILSKGAQSLPIIVATISTSLVIAFVLCLVMNVPGKIDACGCGFVDLRRFCHRRDRTRHRRRRSRDCPGYFGHLPV